MSDCKGVWKGCACVACRELRLRSQQRRLETRRRCWLFVIDQLPRLRQLGVLTVRDLQKVEVEVHGLLEEACKVNGEPLAAACDSKTPEVRALYALFGAATCARMYHGWPRDGQPDPFLQAEVSEAARWLRVAMYSEGVADAHDPVSCA